MTYLGGHFDFMEANGQPNPMSLMPAEGNRLVYLRNTRNCHFNFRRKETNTEVTKTRMSQNVVYVLDVCMLEPTSSDCDH